MSGIAHSASLSAGPAIPANKAEDHSLFRSLTRTLPDGVVAIDETGIVVVYNEAARGIFQYPPETVLGCDVAMLIAPAFVESFKATLAKADTFYGLQPFEAQYEAQGRRQDGTLFPMQVFLGESENDEQRLILAVLRDISGLARERAAHDEEKAYHARIVESVSDAIVSYALDGTVRTWNRAAQELMGYHPDEVIGANVATLMPLFVPPDMMEEEKAVFARMLNGHIVVSHETIRLHRDGTRIPVLLTASPIYDTQGQIIGVARTVKDQRERKALEKERALLDLAINSSDDAFTCIGLDGTILTWNHGAEKMLGYSAAEVVGTRADVLIPKLVLKGDVDTEFQYSRRAASGERVGPYRTTRVRKDGTQVPVMSVVQPVRGEDGKMLAISRTLQDVSARLEYERQRALLSSIVETSNDAVFSKTMDGIVTSWNAAAERMFGYKAEEIIGQPINLIIPEEHAASEKNALAKIRRGVSLRHYETQRRRKDGTTFDASLSLAPLRDTNGAVVGVSSTVRDITERKDYEARLQAMREDMIHVARVQELSQVSAGIAHELNQPLAALLNYASVARRLVSVGDIAAIAKLPDVVTRIGDQAERAGQIIRRMRDFVEKRETHRDTFDLNDIADDAIALALIGSKTAGIDMRFARNTDIPRVMADRVQIQQVLVNLLRNAAEAMAQSERRELSLDIQESGSGFVEVRVSDTGSGIPPHIAEKLFSPFVTTKAEGMGIGLAISKSIIEAHGGEMTAQGNPSGGTTFCFTLPVIDQSVAESS